MQPRIAAIHPRTTRSLGQGTQSAQVGLAEARKLRNSVPKRRERVDALLARLLLAQPDGRELGVREDDTRDRAVVGPGGLPENVRRRYPGLVLADVGEERDAGDVADRPHALRGPAAIVDRNALG